MGSICVCQRRTVTTHVLQAGHVTHVDNMMNPVMIKTNPWACTMRAAHAVCQTHSCNIASRCTTSCSTLASDGCSSHPQRALGTSPIISGCQPRHYPPRSTTPAALQASCYAAPPARAALHCCRLPPALSFLHHFCCLLWVLLTVPMLHTAAYTVGSAAASAVTACLRDIAATATGSSTHAKGLSWAV